MPRMKEKDLELVHGFEALTGIEVDSLDEDGGEPGMVWLNYGTDLVYGGPKLEEVRKLYRAYLAWFKASCDFYKAMSEMYR